MYSLYQFFLYVVASMSLLFSAFVFLKKKKTPVSLNFFALSFSIFIWLFSYAKMYGAPDMNSVYIWAKIGSIGIICIPAFVFFFLLSLIDILLKRHITAIIYVFSACLSLLTVFSNLFIDQIAPYSWGLYPTVGRLFVIFIIYSIFMFLFPVYKIYQYIKNDEVTSLQKQKLIYISLVFTISACMFLFDNLFFFGIFNFEPITYLCALFCISTTAIIISSYNFTNIKIFAIRLLIFFVMLIIVLLISSYIAKLSGNSYLSNSITFLLTLCCFIVYKKIISKTEDLLLAKSRHYQNLLIHAASGMAKEHNLDRLLKLIAIIVLKTIKVSFVAIFLENKEQKNYEIKILRTFSNTDSELLFSYGYEHPLINFIKYREKPFLFDELPQYIANSVVLPFRIALIVPSFFEGVKGFMVIGEKNNKDIFTSDDIGIFQMLARQTSLAMENCLFFDEFKQAQEKIFNAEKLASIGGLAEGVAHQIRNRLNQFSMISGELKYELMDCKKNNEELINNNKNLYETFKYIDEISESLKTNVKRTNDVVKGILDYAKIEAKSIMLSNFNLKEIVDLAYELLNVKHSVFRNLLIVNNFSDDAVIFGVKSQIMEVVYNLIDNSYEAIEEKYNVLSKEEQLKFNPKIEISLLKKDKANIIKFSDNGIGIKEEHCAKIFVPFFTTKSSYKSGTGIGMYIVKRMVVENHNGKIWFDTVFGHGTDIYIELPNT